MHLQSAFVNEKAKAIYKMKNVLKSNTNTSHRMTRVPPAHKGYGRFP